MTVTDFTQKFTFDGAPVRGRLIRLEQTWAQMRRRHDYAGTDLLLLGDLATAAGLMAQDLKLDGSLTIQLRNRDPTRPGRLAAAMAECRNRQWLRGILHGRASASVPAGPDLAALFGAGDLAITLRSPSGDTYQGVVEIGSGGLVAHLERYFATSEQLPTRLWLAADQRTAAGLLLQCLPGAVESEATLDDWRRLTMLVDTVRDAELLALAPETLLGRLFAADRVRVFGAEPVAFGCSCTRERSSTALALMGRAEIESILAEVGRVDVTCEFCGERFVYDAVDAELALRSRKGFEPDTIH
jgi:molecular chaperone Hsp33